MGFQNLIPLLFSGESGIVGDGSGTGARSHWAYVCPRCLARLLPNEDCLACGLWLRARADDAALTVLLLS